VNASLGILPLVAGLLFFGFSDLARQVQTDSREPGVHRGKRLLLHREGGTFLMSIDARGNARMSIKDPAGSSFEIRLGSESLCYIVGSKDEAIVRISLTDQEQAHMVAMTRERWAFMGYFDKKSGFVVQRDPKTAIVVAGSSEDGGGRLSLHLDGDRTYVDFRARSNMGGALSTSTRQGGPAVEVGALQGGLLGWRMYNPDRSEIFRWGLNKSVHEVELQDPKTRGRASLRLENERAPVWTVGGKR